MDIKTISGRLKLVSSMINADQLDQKVLKFYYDNYYKTSVGERKIPVDNIVKFTIGTNPKYYNNISLIVHFSNGEEFTINRRYLSGSK